MFGIFSHPVAINVDNLTLQEFFGQQDTNSGNEYRKMRTPPPPPPPPQQLTSFFLSLPPPFSSFMSPSPCLLPPLPSSDTERKNLLKSSLLFISLTDWWPWVVDWSPLLAGHLTGTLSQPAIRLINYQEDFPLIDFLYLQDTSRHSQSASNVIYWFWRMVDWLVSITLGHLLTHPDAFSQSII